jgi:hypothetical protein
MTTQAGKPKGNSMRVEGLRCARVREDRALPIGAAAFAKDPMKWGGADVVDGGEPGARAAGHEQPPLPRRAAPPFGELRRRRRAQRLRRALTPWITGR